jgi:hypothetical protein
MLRSSPTARTRIDTPANTPPVNWRPWVTRTLGIILRANRAGWKQGTRWRKVLRVVPCCAIVRVLHQWTWKQTIAEIERLEHILRSAGHSTAAQLSTNVTSAAFILLALSSDHLQDIDEFPNVRQQSARKHPFMVSSVSNRESGKSQLPKKPE